MQKEPVEQYCARIAQFQLELDKIRSMIRQENDSLTAIDRKRFTCVKSIGAIDQANEKLGEVVLSLKELV